MAGRILNSAARGEFTDYLVAAIGQAVFIGQLRILYKCAVVVLGKHDKVHFPIVEAACIDRANKLKAGGFQK